jgi:hypothetical protein
MDNRIELEKVSDETMRFMRGKYELDEVSNGKDELKFRRGGKTILAIYIRENKFDFLVIFGKAEREKYESQKDNIPKKIRDIYDNSKTYHDGKWMIIPVKDIKTLEMVKKLILIKKKPNRKPFTKEHAIYSDCGHRCDLCIHYTSGTVSKEFRYQLMEHVRRVYTPDKPIEEFIKDTPSCSGCANGGIDGQCFQKKCAKKKKLDKCINCNEYPCVNAVAGYREGIEARSISADDVTWAILPYVDDQYGN